MSDVLRDLDPVLYAQLLAVFVAGLRVGAANPAIMDAEVEPAFSRALDSLARHPSMEARRCPCGRMGATDCAGECGFPEADRRDRAGRV